MKPWVLLPSLWNPVGTQGSKSYQMSWLWCVFMPEHVLEVRSACCRPPLPWSLGWKVGLLRSTTIEAQQERACTHRRSGCRAGQRASSQESAWGAGLEGGCSPCRAPVSIQGVVAGQGVSEGSCLLSCSFLFLVVSCFSCSPGMQTLVLLLWTGALLGHGSSQNVPSSSEVSRVDR